MAFGRCEIAGSSQALDWIGGWPLAWLVLVAHDCRFARAGGGSHTVQLERESVGPGTGKRKKIVLHLTITVTVLAKDTFATNSLSFLSYLS